MGRCIHPASAGRGVIACGGVADRMSDYLDGELEPEVARAVALHLSRCPGCARIAAELALTIAALHQLSPARGVTLGWLAGRFQCEPARDLATSRLPAPAQSRGGTS